MTTRPLGNGRARGTQRELAVRDLLRAEGWLAFRAPASLGVADVVALRLGDQPRLIEVKSTTRGPYHGFLPADRTRLSHAAAQAGAGAWLVWWPLRSACQWIPESEWPGIRHLNQQALDNARKDAA